jgi:hypothetical protein
MGKLTNEFVEECLDRQDGDVPQLILAIAEGANPTDALLEGLSREEMLDWLKQEFDGLLMHGFEPLLEDGGLRAARIRRSSHRCLPIRYRMFSQLGGLWASSHKKPSPW